MPEYEYGVWSVVYQEIWRSGLTKAEAQEWVDEVAAYLAEGADINNLFVVCRRPVAEWSLDLDD